MKMKKVTLLTALSVAVSLQAVFAKPNKSARQPHPESGFWVTETTRESRSTVVRYYANSNYVVSEKTEATRLDISRLSTRKYLNRQLKAELAKDPVVKTLPKLYEIN